MGQELAPFSLKQAASQTSDWAAVQSERGMEQWRLSVSDGVGGLASSLKAGGGEPGALGRGYAWKNPWWGQVQSWNVLTWAKVSRKEPRESSRAHSFKHLGQAIGARQECSCSSSF